MARQPSHLRGGTDPQAVTGRFWPAGSQAKPAPATTGSRSFSFSEHYGSEGSGNGFPLHRHDRFAPAGSFPSTGGGPGSRSPLWDSCPRRRSSPFLQSPTAALRRATTESSCARVTSSTRATSRCRRLPRHAWPTADSHPERRRAAGRRLTDRAGARLRPHLGHGRSRRHTVSSTRPSARTTGGQTSGRSGAGALRRSIRQRA